MKKLLLLPITVPFSMAKGAAEAALQTTADALVDLVGGGDGGTVATPPHEEQAPVVDLDIASAAPRRRPATRPPRPAPATPPVVPPEPATPAAPPETPREVAEELGLEEGHTDEEPPELVESEGAASAGPEITVDEPWPGYERMRAPDVVDRLTAADDATKAIVRLYEQQHRKRRTVLAATER